jgi:hypothetical protein
MVALRRDETEFVLGQCLGHDQESICLGSGWRGDNLVPFGVCRLSSWWCVKGETNATLCMFDLGDRCLCVRQPRVQTGMQLDFEMIPNWA